MAKTYYLPDADKDRAAWLKNFSSKFSSYAPILGFTPADVASVASDSVAFAYMLEVIEYFKTETQERTRYKDILKNGPVGAALGAVPEFLPLPPPPPVVAAGVFPRVSSLVKRMKAHPNYTEAIGKDCGLIGPEQTLFKDEAKPTLDVAKVGGAVVLKYTKGTTGGIHLMSKRGSETEFSLLAVVTKTSYKDTRTNLVANQPETRHYCAWYMKNDQPIGQRSDQVSFLV